MFVLGKDEYFYLNRDWNEHDFSVTWYYMWEFAKHEGEKKLYNLLNRILLRLLVRYDDELILLASLRYLWSYFIYRKEENKLETDWNITPALLDKLKSRIKGVEQNGVYTKEVLRVKNQLLKRFYFEL